MSYNILVRNAKLSEAKTISTLLNEYAAKGIMLSRDVDSVIVSIRNFFVAECAGEVVGCCAVAFFSEELAEIRSLLVRENYQRSGIGRSLVSYAEQILKDEGIKRVFALTLVPDFFIKIGYRVEEKESFPQKIWRDCLNCPKLMKCDETAVEKFL